MNINILLFLGFEAEEGYCGWVLWLYMTYFNTEAITFIL